MLARLFIKSNFDRKGNPSNGEEDGKAIKLLMPFSSDPQKAVYGPFVDYKTGGI